MSNRQGQYELTEKVLNFRYSMVLLSIVIIWLNIFAIVSAIAIFVMYRVFFWLKYGFWTSYAVAASLDAAAVKVEVSKIHWVGLQKLVIWLLKLPIEGGLMLALVAFWILFNCVSMRTSETRR